VLEEGAVSVIKFRVWNYKEKKYHMPFHGCSTTYNLDYYEGTKHTNYPEQCTGLKDANGKEWFEGDISEDENGVFAVVVFEEGSFCFKWYGRCERGGYEYIETTKMTDYHYNAMTIDGNKHENPELMEQQ
jgi:uncharacterized phage protein (TIGR01671 family)